MISFNSVFYFILLEVISQSVKVKIKTKYYIENGNKTKNN